jgi:hypothetical protein
MPTVGPPILPARGAPIDVNAVSLVFHRDRRMHLGPPQVDPTEFVCGKTIHLHDEGYRGPMVEYRTSDPCRLPVNHDGVCEPVLRHEAEAASMERSCAEEALAEAHLEIRALRELVERLTPDPDADTSACLVLARLLAGAGMDRDRALEVATAGVEALRPALLGAEEPDSAPPAGAVRRLLVGELHEIHNRQAREGMSVPDGGHRYVTVADSRVHHANSGALCGPPDGSILPNVPYPGRTA